MNELPSTEFRKTFAKLEEETIVTANGRPIGIWQPVVWAEHFPNLYRVPEGPIDIPPQPTTQQRRDELLRKINRGKE